MLRKFDAVLIEVRRLAEMPEGRFRLIHSINYLKTPLDHAQHSRNLAHLLRMDAYSRAREGDIDGALASSRALLGLARSLGIEPILMTQLVRMAFEGTAVEVMQWILAQGQPSDAALAEVQDQLIHESAQPLDLIALRGERANLFDLIGKLGAGKVSIQELDFISKDIRNPIESFYGRPIYYRYNQALIMKFLNRAVAIAKQPTYEQPELWDEWRALTKAPGGGFSPINGAVAYLLLPAIDAFQVAYLRTRAQLNCAWLMIAMERYRLAHGIWPDPEKADALRPPPDPWTGAPMRIVRIDGGWAVYSVGPDRTDNGGTFHPRRRTDPGTDVGYRLWDVDRRRRPPGPKAPAEGP